MSGTSTRSTTPNAPRRPPRDATIPAGWRGTSRAEGRHCMSQRKMRALLVAGATAALVVQLGGPASAATVSKPLVTGLVAPLQLAVGSDGTIYVSQTSPNPVTGAP